MNEESRPQLKFQCPSDKWCNSNTFPRCYNNQNTEAITT